MAALFERDAAAMPLLLSALTLGPRWAELLIDDPEAFDLLRVLYHEHVEDLDRLSGVMRQTEHAVHALEDPPSRQARDRLPWLLVGLAGSALATWVTALFEDLGNETKLTLRIVHATVEDKKNTSILAFSRS